MAENLGANYTIDINDLKRGLSKANQLIRESESEFRKAAAGMDDWTKSEEGLEAKIKSLTEKCGLQQKKVDALKTEYERLISEGLDPTSYEASRLRTQINKEEEALNKNKTELDKQTSALNELKSSSEKAKTPTQELTDKINDQEKELDELKQKYKDVILEQGNTSTEAKDLRDKISALSGELNENKQKLNDAEKAADSFDGAMSEASREGKGLDVLSIAIGNFVANAAEKLIEAFGNIMEAAGDAWKSFDEGADAIILATGATGDAANNLIESYANVSRSVLGDSETIGNVLGEVNTRFGLTGEELESMSEQFLKFADITGTDPVKAVQKISRAMEAAGIDTEEYAEVLDQLTKAAQASGVDVDTLMTALDENGTTMRELGLSTDETIAMFAQWEKAGVDSSSTLKGMKTAMANWMKSGKDARTEYAKVLRTISSTGNETRAAEIAVETFGNKAGPELVEAIRSGRMAYDEMLTVVQDSQGAVNATYDETMDVVDKVNLKIQGLKITVGELIDRLLTKYGPDIEAFLDKVDEKLQNISDKDIEDLIDGVNSLINVVKFFTQGLRVSGVAWGEFRGSGESAIQQLGKKVWDFYIYMISEAVPGMIDAWAVGWDDIKQKARNAWDWMEIHGGEWIDNFVVGWKAIIGWVEDKLRGIKNLIEEIIGKASFLTEIGTIAGVGDSVIGAIKLPKMASGGVVRKATQAIIGEDGAEAVIPLERNTEWLDRLAEMIAAKGGGNTYTFNQTNNSPKALSRWEIYRQTRNLMNSIKAV